MIYNVVINYIREDCTKVQHEHTYSYSSQDLNDCKFQAIKYLMAESVKVISITFDKH